MGDPRPSALVYRPGALGDALLAIPALSSLRKALPGHRVLVATHPGVLPLFAANGLADSLVSQDSPRLLWLYGGGQPEPTLATLDTVVVWASDPEHRLWASLASQGARHLLLAPSRPPSTSKQHVADYLLASLDPLGITLNHAVTSPLRPSDEGMGLAKAWLSDRGLLAHSPIAIHPGSGSHRKNWPAERFAELAALLAAQGEELLLLLGPSEEESGAEWRQAWGTTRVHVAEGLAVDTLAAILSRCAAYVGNDSGVSHLAACVGVPTVAIFGPTDPAQWAPRGDCVQVFHDPGWSRLHPATVAQAVLGISRTLHPKD